MGINLKPSGVLACRAIVAQVLAVNALTGINQVSCQHCLRNLDINKLCGSKSSMLFMVSDADTLVPQVQSVQLLAWPEQQLEALPYCWQQLT